MISLKRVFMDKSVVGWESNNMSGERRHPQMTGKHNNRDVRR